jgi:hypothetical protein
MRRNYLQLAQNAVQWILPLWGFGVHKRQEGNSVTS